MKPKIGIVANERFFLTDKIDFWMSYTQVKSMLRESKMQVV